MEEAPERPPRWLRTGRSELKQRDLKTPEDPCRKRSRHLMRVGCPPCENGPRVTAGARVVRQLHPAQHHAGLPWRQQGGFQQGREGRSASSHLTTAFVLL